VRLSMDDLSGNGLACGGTQSNSSNLYSKILIDIKPDDDHI